MPKTRNMPKPRKAVDTSTYTGRFAVRLRSLREKAGLSVEELAEVLEVKIDTIYKWEQGATAPNVADFPKIAEALELNGIRVLFPNK